MKTWKRILVEDDAAPDAREYFEKEVLALIGYSVTDFKVKATIKIDEEGCATYWHHDEYRLSIAADFPYFELSKQEDVPDGE